MPDTSAAVTPTQNAGVVVEQPARLSPPYFDPLALRVELTGYARKAGSGVDARLLVLARLKALLAAARGQAEVALISSGDGRACAKGLSDFQDALISLIYDYVTSHVYRASNPSDAESMAVIATGGYGRGLLAPGSDIDLLFLLPYKQTPWGESVVEAILHFLWDLGQKVGHATRTIEQSLKLANADMTIRTAILDTRLIHGNQGLTDELNRRLRLNIEKGSARPFVEAKLAERDQRHARAGSSRYRVEPNIKDGKGGLRDLHTLHWLAKYLTGDDPSGGAVPSGLFTRQEAATFRRAENFLWTVRCHLHFLTGRSEERLSFDVQPAMAKRLGYRAHHGLSSVERFMKHYFIVAKEVGELTGVLSSALEMRQLKTTPTVARFFEDFGWRGRSRIRARTEFRIDNDRLNVADTQVFARDPVNLIRLFSVAEEAGVHLHPNAERLIGRSLRLIDDKLRADPEANRIFMELLTSKTNAADTLRRMNETGVLGRFLPDFGRVVAMMQFNMYHHFTVDEHLLRTLGEVAAIEAGALKDILPLSSNVIASIQNRRALYLAAFLHDIGKGRDEDHSIVGAQIARALGPRLGLSPAETETTAWLIEEHLTMSNIAQSRDISDPRTLTDFANIVQTPERLKLLLVLTVADIRSVGPDTWNGWKGQLLRQLYIETEPLIAGGHTATTRKARQARAEARLKAALATSKVPAPAVERFIARLYPDYWLKTDLPRQVEHFQLIEQADAKPSGLVTGYKTDAFTSMTELSVVAPNHPRLLSMFAGACAAANANIIGASISTTRDGLALDTFLLQREFADAQDEDRRIKRIEALMGSVLSGKTWLKPLLARQRPPERRIQAFRLVPEVVIDNTLSDALTVIEVSGLDRPGLLHALTTALSDLSLDITSAHITTYGEKAVDVFYVTDLTGRKIESPTRQLAIKERLEPVLAGEPIRTP